MNENQPETARVLLDSWNFSNIFPGYGSLAAPFHCGDGDGSGGGGDDDDGLANVCLNP